MGQNDYYMSLITNGEWMVSGTKWNYEGNQLAKGVVVGDNIKYETIKEKIAEKLSFDPDRYEIELKYISSLRENFPPFEINDEDDCEAFKFLNLKSKASVWPIELYTSLVRKKDRQLMENGYEMKPILERKSSMEHTTVPLSAPQATQSQDEVGRDREVVDVVRPYAHVDRSLDEIIDDDNRCELLGYKANTEDVRKYFQRKSKSPQIVSLSSDDDNEDIEPSSRKRVYDEGTIEFSSRKRGHNFIDLGSPDREDRMFQDEYDAGEGWTEDKGMQDQWYGEGKRDDENVGFDAVDEGFIQEVEGIEENYYRTRKDAKMLKDVDWEDETDNSKKVVRNGVYFNSKEELKDALNAMALENYFQLDVKKSDKNTYVVGCISKDCTFKCRGTTFRKTSLFQVRQFVPQHTCGMGIKNNYHKQASSTFIANKILRKYQRGGKGPRASEIQELMQEMGVKTNYHKANIARLRAKDLARGTTEDSYGRLYSYFYMLEKSNPGSQTCIVRYFNQRFKYAFWSLGAWIRAVPQLRKVISVDGAHLSARYMGVLLQAMAQDGNGQIYPIAFGVVDSENADSWSFFFKELSVIIADEPDVVIVSDRHASIGRGLRKSYSFAKHGFCTYHLYQNFRSIHKRGDLFNLFNRVAKAYTVEEFNRLFAQLCKESEKVGDYLRTVGFDKWARAHFCANRFNILTSNNGETMNSRFKVECGWPIVAMFDGMIGIIAHWFCDRREKAEKWDTLVTSDVQAKLDKRYLRSVKMTVRRLSQFEAEVVDGTLRFAVNLHSRTCDCKRFQIDQIPCTHAIAVAADRGVNVAELVHPMFRNDHLKEVYKETRHAIPPVDRWAVPPSIESIICLLPLVRKCVGRPKVNRYRAPWEKNWSKMRKCGRCGTKGHNQRNSSTLFMFCFSSTLFMF